MYTPTGVTDELVIVKDRPSLKGKYPTLKIIKERVDNLVAFAKKRNIRAVLVVRWSDEKDLWVSGMLAGGSELAGTPAVIDVPLGKGHIVLFGNNPMWRHETHGSFMLLFNTALHYDHLQAGRNEPASASGKRLGRL